MANNIYTSAIVDPTKQQPFLGGSLAFLQNATKEMIAGACRSLMGETKYGLSPGKAMTGCTFNSTLNTIFEGFIFYGDELYYFAGQSGLNAYVNIPVVVLDDTSLSPDPITYSDGSTGSVHRQRRLKVVDQVSGSGLFDLKDMIYVNSNNGTDALLASFSTAGAGETDVPGATYTTPKGLLGMTRNFKFTFRGDMSYGSGLAEGYLFKLKNATSGTLLHQSYADIGSAGFTGDVPAVMIFKYANVPAGNTIKITATRQTTVNTAFQNGYWLVEEYN